MCVLQLNILSHLKRYEITLICMKKTAGGKGNVGNVTIEDFLVNYKISVCQLSVKQKHRNVCSVMLQLS